MAGLARLCKLYGSMIIQGQRFVWDYVANTAVPEKEMRPGSARHAASERAKYEQREMVTMDTLGDAFPREQARVRALLGEYEQLGMVGRFGKTMLEQVLREADEAVLSGDVVAMLAAYGKMERCK